MTSATFVGNDVVDLEEPRTRGKAGNVRFVTRVLDDVEADGLRDAPDPDVELWSLWACKEAAFKVASKVRGGPPVFSHSTFRVRWDRIGGVARPRSGRVYYQDLEFPVMVVCQRDVLHAVAYTHAAGRPPRDEVGLGLELLDDPSRPWGAPLEELVRRLTPREAEVVHSRASAAVRIAARATLAEVMAVDEERIEIVSAPGPPGRRPPRVLLDGCATDADVSLSHHGRWIAWATHVGPAAPDPAAAAHR